MEGQVRSLGRLILAAVIAVGTASSQLARGADIAALSRDCDSGWQDVRYAVVADPAPLPTQERLDRIQPTMQIVRASYSAQYEPEVGGQNVSDVSTNCGGSACSA